MVTMGQRVERLERSVRHWRTAVGLVVLAAAAALVVAASKGNESAEVLRARSLQVVRPDGTIAIQLTAEEEQASVCVSSPDGERAVNLVVAEGIAQVMLMKNKEAPLLWMAADDLGARLHLFGGAEPSQRPYAISLGASGPDSQQKGRAVLNIGRMGVGESTTEAELSVGGPGRAACLTLAPGGGFRVKLRGDKDAGQLQISDREGGIVWFAPPPTEE